MDFLFEIVTDAGSNSVPKSFKLTSDFRVSGLSFADLSATGFECITIKQLRDAESLGPKVQIRKPDGVTVLEEADIVSAVPDPPNEYTLIKYPPPELPTSKLGASGGASAKVS